MKLNEVNKVGFYCSPNDNKRNYIFEVIKNTDDEWLKDAPEHKYLIDEWIFDYIDNDDRYHYGTAGNLVAVPNADDFEVVKIVDKKYKIEGDCGEYLVEARLSYKEKIKKIENLCKKEAKQLRYNPDLGPNGMELTDTAKFARKLMKIING